jgi:exodeoxyribonuclease VII large subunit
MLQARADLQELALSPVFTEFPGRVKDLRYELDENTGRMQDSFVEMLAHSRARLERAAARLSPVRLAAKVGSNGTRLALLDQRQRTAVRKAVTRKDENLKIGMASLDALSPLAVLGRGFSIAENEQGGIIRDSSQVKKGDKLKIRLKKGKLKTEVLEAES